MKEEFSLRKYVVYRIYIGKLNACKWWEVKKRLDAYRWLKEYLIEK